MTPSANPTNKTGQRNLQCSYYGDCLDYAVDHRWQSWDCSKCSNRLMQSSSDAVRSVQDSHVCYELPARISREILHRFS